MFPTEPPWLVGDSGLPLLLYNGELAAQSPQAVRLKPKQVSGMKW